MTKIVKQEWERHIKHKIICLSMKQKNQFGIMCVFLFIFMKAWAMIKIRILEN